MRLEGADGVVWNDVVYRTGIALSRIVTIPETGPAHVVFLSSDGRTEPTEADIEEGIDIVRRAGRADNVVVEVNGKRAG